MQEPAYIPWLERFAEERLAWGDPVPRGASADTLSAAVRDVRQALRVDPPAPLLDLLRIFNGFGDGAVTVFSADALASLTAGGLLAENLEARGRRAENAAFLFVAQGELLRYGLRLADGRWVSVHPVFTDVIEEYAGFDEMMVDILRGMLGDPDESEDTARDRGGNRPVMDPDDMF